MAAFNKLILIGNLTRDPETRFSNNGGNICNFTVAVNSKFGDREETLFMKCIAFNKTAELCQKYMTKGSLALVEGRLQCRDWQKDTGETVKVYELVVNNVQFLSQMDKPAGNTTKDTKPFDDSDIPF